MTNRIMCHEREMLLNFFQLIERHHSWDGFLVLIYRLDAHYGNTHATSDENCFVFENEFSLKLCSENHFQFPRNLGKYSATIIGQIAIYLFILLTCKRSHDDSVINNLVYSSFDQ